MDELGQVFYPCAYLALRCPGAGFAVVREIDIVIVGAAQKGRIVQTPGTSLQLL
jgi:hypothetical protein